MALELVPMPVPWCWCVWGSVREFRDHHPPPAELLPSERGEPRSPLPWGSAGLGQHEEVMKRSLRCL